MPMPMFWPQSRQWLRKRRLAACHMAAEGRALTRSSLSSLSLHLALGVMVGILEPSPAASRRRCLRPTLGGGGGGSHFRFFSCGAQA